MLWVESGQAVRRPGAIGTGEGSRRSKVDFPPLWRRPTISASR